MRTLIRELPYEKPVAAGRYRYLQDGRPTGASESWRLSSAVDGYRFLRVDLNAQNASGNSYLYHLTLAPDGYPERLAFSFFRPGLQIRGNLLFDEGSAALSRTISGGPRGEEERSYRLEEELPLPPGALFWFPATTGLGLLSSAPEGPPRPALTLDPEAEFTLWPTEVAIAIGEAEAVAVMGRTFSARPLSIAWAQQRRRIWVDENGWPLMMERGDLSAIETRLVRYRV
ncbi:MAG: hypothetical protein R3272_02445 [Candidatus Promineifilaceae bacterium]|nr:hypothetical protein [Candidatus Promineifilaceae bacterium]